jgi:hypothetical protein
MAERLVKGQWVPMAFGKPGFGLNKKRAKYGNRKCVWRGEKFDSKREMLRHLVLLDMQKRGEIEQLERQPTFNLFVNGALVCKYVGDWHYITTDPSSQFPAWKRVVEDAKGFQTPEFKLKWKLAKALYPEIDWRLS